MLLIYTHISYGGTASRHSRPAGGCGQDEWRRHNHGDGRRGFLGRAWPRLRLLPCSAP